MKHIFFDLDGTLLPMEQGVFGRGYFEGLTKYFASYGYEPQTFMDALKVSVYSMFENDGSRTNEELFFEKFLPVVNKTREECQPLMDVFYTDYFPTIVKETCGYNEKAKEVIRILKEKGYKIYILTNPLFPPLATQARIKQAGINLEDVCFVTTFDNSTYAKPNPKYYEEVMNKFGITKDDVMMVGNDTREDMAIMKLGVPCYMIEDDLINRDNLTLDGVMHGSFDEFMDYINKLENAH